jgi:energy-coupling factor transporter ATP-binding protein EcfA2
LEKSVSDAVVFDRVTFSYPDAARPALERASLSLPEGAFVLVTGATGAGKSTLLRAMNGLVPHFSGGHFSGTVSVGGRTTTEVPPRALADVVGFVPQDPQAAFVLDRVEDELAYGMENLGLSPSSMRRRVEEMLDLLAIEHLRDRSVRSISGGERQRVAIAAALTPGPRIVVLDEPTSQLDPQAAEDVLAALQRLVHDLGLTVVVAEHRLERVAGFADVAVGCRSGRPPILGPPAEILQRTGIGPPVARLGRLLGWHPVPLTVRDARTRAGAMRLHAAPAPRVRTGSRLLGAARLEARYGERDVLHAIDLEVREGELIAVMGRNGSGKTTLLRCLAGVHAPSGGRVDAPNGAPRPGRDAGLCPQHPEDVLFRDRVIDEVRATVRRGPRGAEAESLLKELGLSHVAMSHPRDLSAGERLLVAVAAIAATGAPVLLLDEPTRGLDALTKERLGVFLSDHASRGGAAVFATHDVELAAALATRVVMLAGGRVIADGSPQEVLGDSPVFAPQTARVFGPEWLTPEEVAHAMATL